MGGRANWKIYGVYKILIEDSLLDGAIHAHLQYTFPISVNSLPQRLRVESKRHAALVFYI